MATSTVPAALDAMVSLFSAGLTAVSVHDGPAVAGDYRDHLSVGWDGDNPEVVEWEQSPAAIRPNHPRDEVFFVACVINAGTGDTMRDRRSRVFAIFAQIETVLRSNITLGGVVQTAQASGGSLLQESSAEDGLTAAMRFRIRVKSRI